MQPKRLFDFRLHDGSRNFADLPETYDVERPQWHVLRAHISSLAGAVETEFVTDDVTEAWICFRFCGHDFLLNNQYGTWLLIVEDPQCPDAILRKVRAHFVQVTGELR